MWLSQNSNIDLTCHDFLVVSKEPSNTTHTLSVKEWIIIGLNLLSTYQTSLQLRVSSETYLRDHCHDIY